MLAQPGSRVEEGDTLVVVESMKMEFAVVAPCAGTVWHLGCAEGAPVGAGQEVAVIVPHAVAVCADAASEVAA
ncbi:hypothetical protein AWV80_03455 [Cupriavidus sp. UYMU48A]|nr:hypothetical protein AWV80_03455 [Cupriavidus sp. UYMU48A]